MNGARPGKVGTAIKMLYIAMALVVLEDIMMSSAYAHLQSPAMVLFGWIGGVVLYLFFIYMISKGHNWARIILLIFFIISVLSAILGLPHNLTFYPIPTVLSIAAMIIDAIAFFFLFQKSSSVWFRGTTAK